MPDLCETAEIKGWGFRVKRVRNVTCPRLLRCVRIVIAVAIILFLIRRVYTLFGEITVEGIAFQPRWLIASLILLLLYFVGLGSPWVFLYRLAGTESRQLHGGRTVARKEGIRFVSGWTFFQLSQFGRYLPGRIGQFVWMLTFSRKFGIENSNAVLATFLQLVCQCCSGCVIGLPALRNSGILHDLLTSLQTSNRFGVPIIVGSVGILTLGAGGVFLYRRGSGKRFLLLIKQSLRTILSVSGVLALGSYVLLWGLLGVAFFLFIKSIYPVEISQVLLVTSSYAAAWNIGFMSFLTPSGLGVREGALSLLLATVVPPATATLLALLARFWTLSVELFLGGLAFGLYFQRRYVARN